MTPPSGDDEALALVHRGWDHLRLQRPLAAWASWQRALRVKPGDPAAAQALEALAAAEELPAAARAIYRFRPPGGADRRARWDAQLKGRDLNDLRAAAEVFAALTDADPSDAAAWYNRALCLAWDGANADAIAALDPAVRLDASDAPDAAAAAWTLAEVLRQGAGAEPLADDLSFSLTLDWPADAGDPIARLGTFAVLRPVAAPLDPATGGPAFPDARVFEWLDRPLPEPAPTLTADDLPRVRASVIAAPGSFRFSSPDRDQIERVERDLRAALGAAGRGLDPRSTPLPLTLLDAAAWLCRLPPGLDDPTQQRLRREAVEHYYESLWVLRPRRGLGGLIDDRPAASPLEAHRVVAGAFGEGPAARARAKLEGVVRLREQLARRAHVAALYGGYPFDRLRRRLGLEPIDPEAVDPADVSCMSPAELERLDPTTLGPADLVDALRSARALCGPRLAARFEAALAERDPSALARLAGPAEVTAPRQEAP